MFFLTFNSLIVCLYMCVCMYILLLILLHRTTTGSNVQPVNRGEEMYHRRIY